MEEEPNSSETTKPLENQLWIWKRTVLPCTASFLLHTLCILVDCGIAYQLMWNHYLFKTGLLVLAFIYIPVVVTFVLKFPDPPPESSIAKWMVITFWVAVLFPVITSFRQLKQVVWSVMVIRAKKPSQEILHEYSQMLTREEESYLFLQAFLHSVPQAILQLHLLFLSVARDNFTENMQLASVLLSIMSVARIASLYHRYQAQVEGGRSPVLLLNPPQVNPSREPLLAVRLCLSTRQACLEEDSPSGKVVLFFAWFFLIFGRITCSVLSLEVYPDITIMILGFHYSIILVYFFLTQHTRWIDVPSRIINASFSYSTLVEVSVRFHRIELLYILFFICIIVEDTFLLFFDFVYSDYNCMEGVLSCDNFSTYAYLILNAHVLGVLVFAIYLAKFQPKKKEKDTPLPVSNHTCND